MYGGHSSLPPLKSAVRRNTLQRIHAVKKLYPEPKRRKPKFWNEIYAECYWGIRYIQHWLLFEIEDHDFEEFEVSGIRYRPDSLESVCRMTNFSKREIQLMYRGFKQGCPTGIVTLKEFKEIYSQFFPQGKPSRYAEFVFNTFDRDHNGSISFEEFVIGLSILTRGSLDDKLEWVFDLYDIKKRGRITREEFALVVQSIYDLMGKYTDPPIQDTCVADHCNEIFLKMDSNSDGLITRGEFMEACRQNPEICSSLALFETRI